MTKRIHLNNAGASLVSENTLELMIEYLRLEQQIGGYEAAAEKSEEIERFYSSVARLVDCEVDEVAFSDSATRAWNTILFSLNIKPNEKIITATTEFGSNVVSLQSAAEKAGAELVVLDVDETGNVDLQDLSKHIDDSLKLVALSHAPAHCGSVMNVREIGAALRDSPAFFLLDACQSVGQFDVSVKSLGCDALVGTGRKWLRGPRGTGFIFANSRILDCMDSVSIDLANADWLPEAKDGSQVSHFKKAQRLQTWERSYAGQIALSNAIEEYLLANSSGELSRKILAARETVDAAVRANKNLKLYPDGNTGSGVVTFFSDRLSADDIKEKYASRSINVSTMSDWDAPWDFARKNLPTLVRVSPHYFNTHAELSEFAACTAEL